MHKLKYFRVHRNPFPNFNNLQLLKLLSNSISSRSWSRAFIQHDLLPINLFFQLIVLLFPVDRDTHVVFVYHRTVSIGRCPPAEDKQESIKVREWIPHIGALTKVIPLNLFLDIVPSSLARFTRATFPRCLFSCRNQRRRVMADRASSKREFEVSNAPSNKPKVIL